MQQMPPGTAPNPSSISPDGHFFWDGRQWVPTVTPDGRWRWNGTAWAPQYALDVNNPVALVQTLRMQAEETFAQAGALLAARRGEWAVDAATQAVLAQADQMAGAAQNDGAQLAAMNQQNVFNKVLAANDRKRLETDLQQATAALRGLIVQIGRGAPVTTFAEADVLLEAARNTDLQAESITRAMADQQQTEASYAARVAAAQQGLQQADGVRASALATATTAVQAATAAYEQAVGVARDGLGEVRMPGAGDSLGAFAGAALYANHIQTADGRGLTAGCLVAAGTAAELWKEHSDLASEAMTLSSAGALAFHEAQTRESPAEFLLIKASGLLSIVAVPAGQEEAGRQFAEQARVACLAAVESAGRRSQAAAGAQANLERVSADRAALDVVLAEQARVETDRELRGAVDSEQAALAAAQADTAEIEAGRGRLAALLTVAVTPPPPLIAAP